MASTVSTTTDPHAVNVELSPAPYNTLPPLITINDAAQLPLKLTSLNSLLFGLDLLGYVDGSHIAPSTTVVAN
ncbi:hypothetical protein Sjap_003578 [Stephania japonica]|uniref:Uncharacterized protein n=1 Tax=Stephania japonica TaxID=461633 RepID=A0AAP0PTP9_9MAGN